MARHALTARVIVMRRFIGVACLAATLTACGGGGGGGGGSSGPANSPPTADAGIDQVVLAGETVMLSALASSDSDGSLDSYLWQQVSGDSVELSAENNADANFSSATISVDQTLQFRLTVTDNDGSSRSDTVAITVNAAQPSASAGVDSVVANTGSFALDASGSSDLGGGIATYNWIQLYGPEVILNDTGAITPVVTVPEISSDTLLRFRLTVVDDYSEIDTDSVEVTVNFASPIADAGEDQSISERRSVFLDGADSFDSGGALASYFWTQLSGPTVSLSGADSSMARFTAPSVDGEEAGPLELSFQLTVTDNLGSIDTDVVSVRVTNTLIAPVADGGDNKTVDTTGANSSVPVSTSLMGDESSDPDGMIVTYLWEQTSPADPNVQLSGVDQAQATVTIDSELGEDIELFFRLTVTDNEGQTDSDTVKVTALAPREMVSDLAISGTISIAPASQLDSDINDSATTPLANGEFVSAQLMPSPSIVGGYVNIANEGSDGNSFADGDVYDTYRVTLLEGQSVLLLIGSRTDADLDLWLYNLDGDVVDSSLSDSSNESVVAPADGEYFIDVEAWSGFSTYNLAIGLDQAIASNGFRLSDEFIPLQIIAKASENQLAKASQAIATVGMQQLSRGNNGAELYQLVSTSTTRLQAMQSANPRRQIGLDQQQRYSTLLAAKQLQQSGAVQFAHPNYKRKAMARPNDPRYNQQWHYPLIDLDLAWDIAVDVHPSGVVAAVIDTGSLPDHPDLIGQFTGGYDFISDASSSGDGDGIDSDPTDPGDGGGSASSFHGTHVAGTIAAASNNGIGVSGVSWKTATTVLPLRVLGEFGGTTYDVVQAIRYAGGLSNDSGITLPAPADIINLSLGGGGGCSSLEQDTFDEVRAAGVLVAVAAGNDSENAANFSPANCEGVFTVSAVDATRELAWYSNFGDTIEVAAPGGDTSRDSDGDGYPDGVLSTLADDTSSSLQYEYTFYQGTSMATPHFAGVLALMKSANPDLTPEYVDVLLASGSMTDDIGDTGQDSLFGWGLVNARKAVAAAIDVTGEPLPALLVLSPSRVNFGTSYTRAMLTARNAGGGELEVVSVVSSQPWLTLEEPTSGDGLGIYTLLVDREGLAAGSYSAQVTFNSDANQRIVEVSMFVSDSDFSPQVGPIYALLVNNDTEEVVADQALVELEGEYSYSFENLSPGSYRVLAGSDFDNDFYICDAGEACGRFQTRSNPTVIELTDINLTDIDFRVEYEVAISASSEQSTTELALPRKRVTNPRRSVQ